QAVYAALSEAEEFINKQPGEAAQIYIKTTNDKRSSEEEMTKFISDPDNIWTTVPQQTMTFAGFMHKVGTMKRLPASWKDLYMPECHELEGSLYAFSLLIPAKAEMRGISDLQLPQRIELRHIAGGVDPYA